MNETARFIAIRDGRRIKFYKLGKSNRPLTEVRHRIFRTDDKLMWHDTDGSMAVVMYDIDGTQPYGTGEYLDPDMTKVWIDLSKAGTGVRVNRLSELSKNWVGLLVVGLVIYALLRSFF